ncbi:hypothetical protein RvY_11602 [Ramazzottius varieornatus]|uniref:G-protein coupled receptors family 1 profile domain-containing protein n=1 Tax=Ramazzottius varieornatus TaxID=947166 RepID=A0A1D1VGM7_RAMVA|nr:hypothetical protein RvY_11602 [Ramazzottius varieornatus]
MAECTGGFCNPALDEANVALHLPSTFYYSSASLADLPENYPDSVLCANFTPNITAPPAVEMGHNSLLLAVNIYYGLIYIVGMCGNSLVLYVVCRYSKMHTVTNFFILSLALADICFLINVPFLMVTAFKNKWIFGDFYCKIFLTMTTVNQFASSFFLLVMSADRYFAVW